MVAASLDGYIAGPNGEADWIVMDPDVDFGALFNEFDTLLVGRKTFEVMAKDGRVALPGMKTLVVSRAPALEDHPGVAVLADNVENAIAALRASAGKDIWLFGGGVLFRSLVAANLVDTVEVAIMPVLLGGGIPLLPSPAERAKLKLVEHKVYKRTGIVSLKYNLLRAD